MKIEMATRCIGRRLRLPVNSAVVSLLLLLRFLLRDACPVLSFSSIFKGTLTGSIQRCRYLCSKVQAQKPGRVHAEEGARTSSSRERPQRLNATAVKSKSTAPSTTVFALPVPVVPFIQQKRKNHRLSTKTTTATGTGAGTSITSAQTSRNSKHGRTGLSIYVNLQAAKDVKTQIQYARNGHAVLRKLLLPRPILSSTETTNTATGMGVTDDGRKRKLGSFTANCSVPFLLQLRETLLSHGQTHELAAWRQKIAVAADHNPARAHELAMSCQTVEQCRIQYQRLVKMGTTGTRGGSTANDEDHDLPFLQYFNTWRTIPDVEHVAATLAQAASILMDVPSVRLYQDAVFWKRPWDGPTPWHVDARMAPFDTSHMITFWIPLQPVQRSGLLFCSKSHSDFALPYWNDQPQSTSSEASSSPWNNLAERYSKGSTSGDNIVDYMPLALGDVTVHSGWTLHCANGGGEGDGVKSPLDQEANSRLALAVTFVDARAPIRHDAVVAVQLTRKQDAKAHLSTKADREDIWSYQDWVHQVPALTSNWRHPLAPILWPTSKHDRQTN